MSLIGKYVAPALICGSSAIVMFQHRELLRSSRKMDFAKGSLSLTVGVVLQVMIIRRSAMGGNPSNVQGLLAFMYPLLLLASHAYSFMLYNSIPPQAVLLFLTGPSRLGASGNHPVYQYRLNDVIDRVRSIVGDRIQKTSDDVRER